MSLLTGYCGGDVWDLQGQHHYDDSRYAVADQAPRSTVLVMGANHNFWNTEWSSVDDWGFNPDTPPCGTATPTRLTLSQQQAIGRTYISAFFRLMLGGETAFVPLFDGSLSFVGVEVVAQAAGSSRLDVSRLDRPLPAGSVSGSVTATTCDDSISCVDEEFAGRFPHWVPVLLVPKVPEPADHGAAMDLARWCC